jgi:hypothetical protein
MSTLVFVDHIINNNINPIRHMHVDYIIFLVLLDYGNKGSGANKIWDIFGYQHSGA